jgi:hypothetical protein
MSYVPRSSAGTCTPHCRADHAWPGPAQGPAHLYIVRGFASSASIVPRGRSLLPSGMPQTFAIYLLIAPCLKLAHLVSPASSLRNYLTIPHLLDDAQFCTYLTIHKSHGACMSSSRRLSYALEHACIDEHQHGARSLFNSIWAPWWLSVHVSMRAQTRPLQLVPLPLIQCHSSRICCAEKKTVLSMAFSGKCGCRWAKGICPCPPRQQCLNMAP